MTTKIDQSWWETMYERGPEHLEYVAQGLHVHAGQIALLVAIWQASNQLPSDESSSTVITRPELQRLTGEISGFNWYEDHAAMSADLAALEELGVLEIHRRIGKASVYITPRYEAVFIHRDVEAEIEYLTALNALASAVGKEQATKVAAIALRDLKGTHA